jgi:GntR family transcriptional regulator, transcriptional repressor for pyruvate dehydrogenase complex
MKQIRLSDQLAEALLRRIRSERMRPGDKLPTEAELSSEFGLSRTVVREAMRSLVARGIVDVRAGSGAVVAEVEAEAAAESLALFLEGRPDSDYDAMHEVREALEVRSARCAALRATPADITRLEASHEAMVARIDSPDIEALALADVSFHASLAAASKNEILRTMLDAFRPVLMRPREVNLVEEPARTEAVESHAAILAAVRDRDPEAAEEAMRQHMAYAIETYRRLLAASA